MAGELDALGKALASPARPLVAIVAGSKVSTKLTILDALAKKVDFLIVGGGIANTFMLAAGLPIGEVARRSGPGCRSENASSRRCARAAPRCRFRATWWSPRRSPPTPRRQVKPAAEVAADDMILDIGPQTAQQLAGRIATAGTVVWNGPVGVFEIAQFAKGTEVLAGPSLTRRPSRSPAAATPSPRSTSSASPIASATSRRRAARFSSFSKARRCRRSPRSRRAPERPEGRA